jgi:hypothetical protein
MEIVKSLAIEIVMSLLRPARSRQLTEPTYERLRLARMWREDIVQWRE